MGKCSKNLSKRVTLNLDTESLYGNKSKPLFAWLNKSKLLPDSTSWIDVDVGTREANSPLHRAVIEGSLEEVQKILKEEISSINVKNPQGCTPLHLAVQHQHLSIVKWLLEQGALPNYTDLDGRAPLHDALQAEQPVDYVNLLLEHGANQNIIDDFGDTPLELAIKLQEKTSEEILRKHAAHSK